MAMSMIKRGEQKDATSLTEFSVSRHAVGRGGEHNLLRWNEARYDPFFCAPDFNWNIQKQGVRQCMLLFCDWYLYCLCPFWAFAVFFMYGGARRSNYPDEYKDFVFPYLHSIRSDGVARPITTAMQQNIKNEVHHKSFTSRLTCKGGMTEMQMNPDLNIKEEYGRSGHTILPGGNTNAEGYIESTPVMNFPGVCLWLDTRIAIIVAIHIILNLLDMQ
jgi:hypothetical protein